MLQHHGQPKQIIHGTHHIRHMLKLLMLRLEHLKKLDILVFLKMGLIPQEPFHGNYGLEVLQEHLFLVVVKV